MWMLFFYLPGLNCIYVMEFNNQPNPEAIYFISSNYLILVSMHLMAVTLKLCNPESQ